MNDDKLIIFAGAGISQNSGYPSWGELIQEIKKELNLNDDEDDYLKIPQYYYDTYGQQKYLDKIIEVFDKNSNATPNKIHTEINKLNPKHIITTNYDTLIEDKMNSGIHKYEVISEDLDIPYSLSGNYIIKMHGDINKKNFVLKEDDYFDYEKNFQMISTLIKSLIMNNTVLFVGYSLGDSTFNSIFRLINSYFGNNAKNAYFYTPKKTPTILNEYYNKKGIKVLTNDNNNTVSLGIGDRTVLFLSDIVESHVPKYKTSDDIWNQVSSFDKLSYIEGKDLVKYIEMNDKAKLNPTTQDTFEWIKINDNDIGFSKDDKLINFIREKTNIIEFLGISTSSESGKKPNTILNKAFQKYKQGQYSAAMIEFRKIANESFLKKDYVNYAIAEFNVNQLKMVAERDNKSKELTLKESVFEDQDFTDIMKNIYDDSNKNEKKVISFLKEEIFNYKYIYKKFYKVHGLYNKIKKERHLVKKKGESFNNYLLLLSNEIHNLNAFLNFNCICLEHYKDYEDIINLYFESLLMAFDINYINADNKREMYSSSRIESFDKNDLKNTLPYIDIKMLPVYFDYLDIKKILITEEAFIYITDEIISNLKESYKRNSLEYRILRKNITFLYYIEIYNYQKIIDILEEIPLYWEMNKEIRILLIIINTHYNKLDKEDKQRLFNIINRHLDDIYNHKLSLHYDNYYLYSLILEKMEIILESQSIHIENLNDNLTLIKVGQHKIKNIEEYGVLIINLYNYLEKESTDIIDNILTKYNRLPDDKVNYEFIVMIIIAKIYDFDNLKQSLFNNLILKANEKQSDNIRTFPDPQEIALSNLYNLYIKDYYTKNEIKESIDINKCKGILAEFDWLILDNYDIDILTNLVERRNLENTKKYFIKNGKQQEVLDEWKNKEIQKKFNHKT